MKQCDYILLDRSGSMRALWREAIGSVNAYIKGLASGPNTADILVTVVCFDTGNDGKLDYHVLRKGAPARATREVSEEEIGPRGMTPLFDAAARLANEALADAPDKAAIIIMTDGEENSSREYTKETITKLLDACRAKDWPVIFLGANFDNARQASSVKNYTGHTMSVMPEALGSTARRMSQTRSDYASAGATGQSMNFTPEDRRMAQGKPDDNSATDFAMGLATGVAVSPGGLVGAAIHNAYSGGSGCDSSTSSSASSSGSSESSASSCSDASSGGGAGD